MSIGCLIFFNRKLFRKIKHILFTFFKSMDKIFEMCLLEKKCNKGIYLLCLNIPAVIMFQK